MSVTHSKLHHCIGQIAIAEGTLEPPAPKCTCRKQVTLAEATRMVKQGEASWAVIKRTQESVEDICRLCSGDPEVKNCANCHGTGKEKGTRTIEHFGNDLVLISTPPADKKEKKRSSVLAMKTPRVATIEEEHIELAYVYKIKEAAERIEEYGRLILDARTFVGKNRTFAIGIEPEGIWIKNRNTGKLEYERDPNWGRPMFVSMPSTINSGGMTTRLSRGFKHLNGLADTHGEDKNFDI